MENPRTRGGVKFMIRKKLRGRVSPSNPRPEIGGQTIRDMFLVSFRWRRKKSQTSSISPAFFLSSSWVSFWVSSVLRFLIPNCNAGAESLNFEASPMVERNKPAGACAGGGRSRKMGNWMNWMIKIMAAYVVVMFIYLTVLTECQARLPQLWPTGHPLDAGRADPNAAANSVIEKDEPHRGPPVLPPRRDYKSNGYLLVSSNGGLNQMRAGICDMVAIARYLNLTLVVPELDKRSFWADQSDFGDIFDVKHFIDSLRDEVKIVKSLPNKFDEKVNSTGIFSMPPVSWSNESYYLKMILPLIRKHRVVHFLKTDSRLANNGLPVELQRLRCRVNYEALRFTPEIEVAGDRIISTLQKNGFFVALHLRYEMDMLSFTGCSHGCSDAESDELTKMRYANPVWKDKGVNSKSKRLQGLCPLTPEEIALVLQGLGIQTNTQIYVASGEIYGGERRMAVLKATFPKFVSKEMLLTGDELISFQNHSSRMAAVDYMVSVASDIFISSHDGNMGRLVEGHRRYNGFQKTIQLDKKMLVELIDLYQDGKLSLIQFSSAVMEMHRKRMGLPTTRNVIPRRPKEEDYFYANPEECLNQPRNINIRWRGYDI